MAVSLTERAEAIFGSSPLNLNIILEIDGIDLVFGSIPIGKIPKYGDNIDYGDIGLVYGGVVQDPRSRDYISLSGTTTQLTNQIEIDKGGIGSVQNFTVTLIDSGGELSRIFAPGNTVPDVLGRDARVYLSAEGLAHPEDSVPIITGTITSFEGQPGAIRLTVQHPDYLRKGDLFIQRTTELSGNIDASQTSIQVDDVTGFIDPNGSTILRTYIQINDELIEYTGINVGSNTFTGCTRAQLDTIAASHDEDDEVTSFYRLIDQPLDLALKLMLSEPTNSPFVSDVTILSFEFAAGISQENGVLFESNTRNFYGLEIGDLVTITGATNASNNVIEAPILAFIDNPLGEFFVLNDSGIVLETDTTAKAAFKSQYNVLPDGQGQYIKPYHVDVARFTELNDFFGNSLPELDIYIKDTINLKDFLPQQVYFPLAFYATVRKSRISVAQTEAPLVVEELPELDETNLVDVNQHKIVRQLNDDFYNTLVYKFDIDSIEDKYKAAEVVVSEKSFNRINAPVTTLNIESDGLRDTPLIRDTIRKQARKLIDRYSFGAESITVKTFFAVGFQIELSDIVLFGSPTLQLPDSVNGGRDFQPRLMEVVKKSTNLTTGQITLTLLDTGSSVNDSRFGVFSPNSYLDSGSTATSLKLKRSFTTGEFEVEREKWRNFINQNILIRSEDYSFQEEATLIAFDPNDDTKLLINPALSISPPEDYLVDLPPYNLSSLEEYQKAKSIHVFTDPFVEVVTGVDNFSFTVAPADIGLFFVGSFVYIHSPDFTIRSRNDAFDDDAVVSAVDTGTNTVTVDRDLGFTPAAGYGVQLIGFNGDTNPLPYRYV